MKWPSQFTILRNSELFRFELKNFWKRSFPHGVNNCSHFIIIIFSPLTNISNPTINASMQAWPHKVCNSIQWMVSLGFEDEFGGCKIIVEMNSECIYNYSGRLNRNDDIIKIICSQWILQFMWVPQINLKGFLFYQHRLYSLHCFLCKNVAFEMRMS